MKTILISLFFAMSLFAQGGGRGQGDSWSEIIRNPYLKAGFPSIIVNDALSTKFVSSMNFCMSDDESELRSIEPMKVCLESRIMNRGRKKCLEYADETVVVKNSFARYTCSHPRCEYRSVSFTSYERVMNIPVRSFDPRGGLGDIVMRKEYEFPYCD